MCGQGEALEDFFGWALVRSSLLHGGPTSLGDLLQPFLARSDSTVASAAPGSPVHAVLLPTACEDLQVHLTHGRRADGDQWKTRCPLELLAEDPHVLVHHTHGRMGGPDWMFAAHGTDGTAVPVILQGKNSISGTVVDALSSPDMAAGTMTAHERCPRTRTCGGWSLNTPPGLRPCG